MTPEAAVLIVTEIARFLEIDVPDDERYMRFFTAQVIETVKTNRKKAVMYDELVLPLRKAVQGRS